MTYPPIPDSADAEPAGPAASSANGTRPRSALLVACEPAAADLDGPRHQAIDTGTEGRAMDLDAAERAAADFLAALGIDLDAEERQETPARMARAYAELFAAEPFRLTTFPNDERYDELVVARAIPFRTVCEHHMLLFSGVALAQRLAILYRDWEHLDLPADS